jgi:hypothetical protein
MEGGKKAIRDDKKHKLMEKVATKDARSPVHNVEGVALAKIRKMSSKLSSIATDNNDELVDSVSEDEHSRERPKPVSTSQ